MNYSKDMQNDEVVCAILEQTCLAVSIFSVIRPIMSIFIQTQSHSALNMRLVLLSGEGCHWNDRFHSGKQFMLDTKETALRDQLVSDQESLHSCCSTSIVWRQQKWQPLCGLAHSLGFILFSQKDVQQVMYLLMYTCIYPKSSWYLSLTKTRQHIYCCVIVTLHVEDYKILVFIN